MTLCFQCRGACRFHLWLGAKIPHAAHCNQNKKKTTTTPSVSETGTDIDRRVLGYSRSRRQLGKDERILTKQCHFSDSS